MFQPQNDGNPDLEKPQAYSPPLSNYVWYLQWLAFQLSTLPESIKLLLDEGSDPRTENLAESKRFRLIFSSVYESLRSKKASSIDDVIEYLEEKALLEAASDVSEVLGAQRLLVF